MNFSEHIKAIRTERGLTQEEFAGRLAVTRQAVSNWENGKNLPDIEMLILIAGEYDVSLDYLILGENREVEDITKKLIDDGSEGRRAKRNTISLGIGAALLLFGMVFLIIKGLSVEYVDDNGILHENFFLLPLAFMSLFGSFCVFLTTGIRSAVSKIKRHKTGGLGTGGGL